MAFGDRHVFNLDDGRYEVRVVAFPGAPMKEKALYERIAIRQLDKPGEPELMSVIMADSLKGMTRAEFAENLKHAREISRVPSGALAVALVRQDDLHVTTLAEWRIAIVGAKAWELADGGKKRTEPPATFTDREAQELSSRLQQVREALAQGGHADFPIVPTSDLIEFVRRGGFAVRLIE